MLRSILAVLLVLSLTSATAQEQKKPYFIRISIGDKVNVAMSPYDLGKARITFRHA